MIINKKNSLLVVISLLLLVGCTNDQVHNFTDLEFSKQENSIHYLSYKTTNEESKLKIYSDTKRESQFIKKDMWNVEDYYPAFPIYTKNRILYQSQGLQLPSHFFWYSIKEGKFYKEYSDYLHKDSGFSNFKTNSDNILFETVSSHITGLQNESENLSDQGIKNSLCNHDINRCVESSDNTFSINVPILEEQNGNINWFRATIVDNGYTIKRYVYTKELDFLYTKELYSTEGIGENTAYANGTNLYFVDNFNKRIMLLNDSEQKEIKFSNSVDKIIEVHPISENKFFSIVLSNDNYYNIKYIDITDDQLSIYDVEENDKIKNAEYISVHYIDEKNKKIYLLKDGANELIEVSILEHNKLEVLRVNKIVTTGKNLILITKEE